MILIGEEGTKRTEYIRRAAAAVGTDISFIPWSHFPASPEIGKKWPWEVDKRVVKIDPPSYSAFILEEGAEKVAEYLRWLEHMENCGAMFLNEPSALQKTLDKRATKKILQEKGIPVTKMFSEKFTEAAELLHWMETEHIPAVFIKPRFFSGAAGVMALRIQRPGTGMAAYTSCRVEDGRLVNTKHLFCLRREEEILPVLDRILALDAVVEQWHRKEVTPKGRYSYDLRVVWQFGHIAFWVARGARGPITNLHLNNHVLPAGEITLSEQELSQLETLCRDAAECFPGLNTVGIDVMLEMGSRRPLIIEMNGQGDLIYQDLYGENQIYREQMEQVMRWEMAGGIGNHV